MPRLWPENWHNASKTCNLIIQPRYVCCSAFLRRLIPAEEAGIRNQGERAAEQAAMALDSLFVAYNKNVKPANAPELRTAINGLFQQVESPSHYNPGDFARQMRKVNSLLR